jgi:MFS family permease
LKRGKSGIHIQKQEKMFGANFLLAFFCNVCVISNLVFFLFFNRYLEELGASEAQIGVYMGALAFGSVVVRPMVGAAVDRYGRRRLIFFGILLMMLATIGYFLCRDLNWEILVVRALHGAGFGCYITGIFTIIVDDAPVTRRAKVIGVFGLSGMSTYAIFPMMAESIIRHFGFRALFATALFSLTAGFVLSMFLKEQDPVRFDFPPISFIRLLGRVELLIPVGALFFFCTGVGALVNFIAVYLAPMKLSISFFFIASSLAGVIVRFNLGDLADIYGRRRVAFPAFTAGSLALFWLGNFHYRWELLLSGLLYGIGIGLAVPAVAALIVDRVKPQDRGKGLALFTASFDFGVMAGSFVYGAVAGFIGYSHMYFFAAAVMLISAVIICFF